MRFIDREEILQQEISGLRSAAAGIRRACDDLPDLDAAERRQLRNTVFTAWVRWRIPKAQQQVAMAASTLLAALSMMVAIGVACLAAAVDRGQIESYAVILFAALCWGVTINRWEIIRVNLSRSRRPTHRSLAGSFPAVVSFLLLLTSGVAGGLGIWLLTRLGAGQLLVASAGVLFALCVGLGTGLWMRLWIDAIHHRYKHVDRERPLDGALYILFMVSARSYALSSFWWHKDVLRSSRQHLTHLATDLRRASVVHRRTSVKEWAVRRQGRLDNAVLAELVERHSSELARVRTATEYRRLCDSLFSGVRSLAAEDLEELFAHQAAEPVVPRASRLLQRFLPAIVLVTASLLIPLLPGVAAQTGDGVRWLLLMTALLSLAPANDLMSGTVRAALDKSLFPSKP
ncbi:hypothetical protein [Streptomyces sp. ok210]|uniref:hypothetical protein n=1 Tax=Streptomyces sp. ok210 TaxID=1761905 RepID=UPI000B80D1DF|nr:hypothetical protein [Streptomyces sp. ok210]